MQYIHKETKEYPLEPQDIINRHGATVSFPIPFEPTEEYAEVKDTEPPLYNEMTQYLELDEPIETEEGFVQVWKVLDYSAEEIEKRQKEAEERAKEEARIIVPRHKGLLALFRLKSIKESDIQAAISQMQDPDEAYEATIYFNNAEWHSDSEWVISLGAALNISDEELDELFKYAVTL